MLNIISLDLLATTSEHGYSLDELVYRTQQLFETEGMAGFVSLVLELTDEKLCSDILRNGKTKFTAGHCDNPRYQLHDKVPRQFRTSVGVVRIRWRRLKCMNCGGSSIPLRYFLGLEPYQSKSSELEQMVVEVVSEQSYRRSTRHLGDIGSIPIPRSTAHRWVAESDCDQLETNRENLDVLMADGTGYKRRPDRAADLNNRGELRVTMGVDKQGNLIPLGAFSGESWENIAEKIKNDMKKDPPLADVLVSDGERGLVNSLGSLCKQAQRCHWHIVRDLNYTMWQDKAPKKERDSRKHDLTAILGIEIPEEEIEVVNEEDSENIIERLQESEKRITELISSLADKGYNTAADYVKRASRNMFSYVRRWLRTGIVTPRVSSLIERMMREIARRLKRIAFGWSEEGAAKMAQVIIKRITSAGEWEKYWKNKLRIEGNVVLTLNSIRHKPPQTLGR